MMTQVRDGNIGVDKILIFNEYIMSSVILGWGWGGGYSIFKPFNHKLAN